MWLSEENVWVSDQEFDFVKKNIAKNLIKIVHDFCYRRHICQTDPHRDVHVKQEAVMSSAVVKKKDR